jgi:hypothetical protein
MFSPLILSLAGVFALTPQQQNDSILYMQSLVTPPMFDHCKALQPERATSYDEAWTAWSKKNKRAVARGEKTLRQVNGGDGAAAAALVRGEAEAKIAEIKAMPAAEQQERCEGLLELTRSEG